MFRLYGHDLAKGVDYTAWIRPGAVVAVGPGSRIEYIGPRPAYNWAEGSRAIEARKGAAALRSRAFVRYDRRAFADRLQAAWLERLREDAPRVNAERTRWWQRRHHCWGRD